MTVKITQVSTSNGEITLTVTYNDLEGKTKTFQLRKTDLYERLLQIRTLLGRPLTLTDAREAIVALTNEVRKGNSQLPENFDFTTYIGVELET